MGEKPRKQLNFRIDDDFEAALEWLRRQRSPLPRASDMIRQAVMEKLDRERGDKRAARR